MTTTYAMHPVRQRRLNQGWQPMQLIGRVEVVADHAGIDLPKTYELLRNLFLWEQHREPIPAPYGLLIEYALRYPNALIPERTTPQSEAGHACASC